MNPIRLLISCSIAMSAFAEDGSVRPQPAALSYPMVDTGQDRCFSDTQEIAYPKPGEAYHGQDAQFQGNQPAYRDNGDGTVSDLVTGLMWVKTPELKNKSTFAEAVSGAAKCRVGGHSDWRLPTIKELYSLIDFRGYSARTQAQSKPYIDPRIFDFCYGNESAGERLIDAQYWSATEYVGQTMGGNATVFGVNFADGRIKGYPKDFGGRRQGANRQFVRYVRGNPKYGKNDFQDNGDGTVTDLATDLMWAKADSGKGMNWEDALAWVQKMNQDNHLGHNDWRLPNAKELQSIVDYSRSPDAKDARRRGPAIDPVFQTSQAESWCWTGTTHLENRTCGFAVYVCFGQAFGTMQGKTMNVHGAGAQRSDPKAGDPSAWAAGNGPQGDEVRILNYVRCVRGGSVSTKADGPPLDGRFGASRRASGGNGREGRDSGRPDDAPGGFVEHLDKNGDGKVSRSEFDGPRNHFDVLDRNHDGYLSKDEAPKGPPPSSNGRPPPPKR
jgi:hypothetical protein